MAIVAVFGLLEVCYDLAVLVLDDWGLIELYSFILRRQMQTSLAVIHILLIDGVKCAAATHHHQICRSLLHLHAVSTVANSMRRCGFISSSGLFLLYRHEMLQLLYAIALMYSHLLSLLVLHATLRVLEANACGLVVGIGLDVADFVWTHMAAYLLIKFIIRVALRQYGLFLNVVNLVDALLRALLFPSLPQLLLRHKLIVGASLMLLSDSLRLGLAENLPRRLQVLRTVTVRRQQHVLLHIIKFLLLPGTCAGLHAVPYGATIMVRLDGH